MYNDSEIGLDFSKLELKQEPIVDSCQDDDQATDDEVIEAGT